MAVEKFQLGLCAGKDEMIHVIARFSAVQQMKNYYTPEEAMRIARGFLHTAKDAHAGNWRDGMYEVGLEVRPSMTTVGDSDSEGIVVVAHFGRTAIHFEMSPDVAYELAEKAKANHHIERKAPWEMELGE